MASVAGAKAGPLSWRILGGPPSIEQVAECMIMLRQHGASFRTKDNEAPIWTALGCVFKGHFRQGTIAEPDHMKLLGQSMMGHWLPSFAQAQVNTFGELIQEDDNLHYYTDISNCFVCQSDIMTNPVKLYCGHSFCCKCILSVGKRDSKCPICFRRLCLDIVPDRDNRTNMLHEKKTGNDGNIDENFYARLEDVMNGLDSLSETQVAKEAEYQECHIGISRDELKEFIKKYHRSAIQSELSATTTITDGEHNCIMAPRLGPFLIDIMVKGVPVIASISNNSRYTIISPSLVKSFNLKRIECLKTSKMRDGLTGRKVKNATFTCLENFEFSIGEIKISLRNAVEADLRESKRDMHNKAGIQLGQDFFLSAAYCILTAESPATTQNAEVSIMVDGLYSWFVINRRHRNIFYSWLVSLLAFWLPSWFTFWLPSWLRPLTKSSETLRYYAHTGETAVVPLLHFNPLKTERINVLTVKPDETFHECGYCCRMFPAGMMKCTCRIRYCDKRCQNLAWKIHKVTHHQSDQSG